MSSVNSVSLVVMSAPLYDCTPVPGAASAAVLVQFVHADGADFVFGDAGVGVEGGVGEEVGGVFLELDEWDEQLSGALALGIKGAALEVAAAGADSYPLAVGDAVLVAVGWVHGDGELGGAGEQVVGAAGDGASVPVVEDAAGVEYEREAVGRGFVRGGALVEGDELGAGAAREVVFVQVAGAGVVGSGAGPLDAALVFEAVVGDSGQTRGTGTSFRRISGMGDRSRTRAQARGRVCG